jgi:hemolysin activation/secretion protein
MKNHTYSLLPRMTALSLLSLAAGSVQAAPVDAGQALQEIRQAIPPVRPPVASPEINIKTPEPGQSPAASPIAFKVTRIEITGATRFPANTLNHLVESAIGHRLSLGDLQALAARITRYYRAHGYPVARAYIPPQEIRAGQVHIAVIEGHYGKVRIHHPGAPKLLLCTACPVAPGAVIAAAPLERELLLLSDLPGLNVRSTLGPGAVPGTSDLEVDMTAARTVSGRIDTDNYGNRYTGRNRAGGLLNLANLTGRGDLLSVQGLTAGHDLDYGRLAYQLPANGNGLIAGGSLSDMRYTLGDVFTSLHAAGTAKTATVFSSYPLLRTRRDSIWMQLSFDHRRLHDQIGATQTDTEKRIQALGLGLNGAYQWEQALATWSANLTDGQLNIQSPAAAATDQLTAQTAGRYAKLELNVAPVIRLGARYSLSLAYHGQLTSRNLDSSEKFSLGGIYGVRAYPQDKVQADVAHLLNVELRRDFSSKMTAFGLVDIGRGQINRNTWPAAGGQNEMTLAGAGIGVNWQPARACNVRMVYAVPAGPQPTPNDPDRSGRLWLQAAYVF